MLVYRAKYQPQRLLCYRPSPHSLDLVNGSMLNGINEKQEFPATYVLINVEQPTVWIWAVFTYFHGANGSSEADASLLV